MKKTAFTIFELIVVFIIIGVLSSIAISIKNNAKDETFSLFFKNGIKELVSYYILEGGKVNFNDINSSKPSSQIFYDKFIKKDWATIKDNNHFLIYSNRNSKKVCVKCITDGIQIEVETNSSNNDTLCKDIKKIISKDRNYSIFNNKAKF